MSKDYDILMIATGRDANLLNRLIASLRQEASRLRLCLVIVNQGPENIFTSREKADIQTINVNHPLSLSKARNIGLKFVKEQNIAAIHLMFPDDDTTFDPEFFEVYENSAEGDKAYLGRVCTQEDGSDYKAYPQKKEVSGTTELLPYVASVALIIPQRVVEQVGLFEEKLGAGAEWASSEDLDYFLRCTACTPFVFVRAFRNFHPSRFGKYENLTNEQIRKRFRGYTDGYLFVMFRYNLKGKILELPWRALGGALVSLLKGAFRLVPIYLWLAAYRVSMIFYLNRKKKEKTGFFAYNEV